MTDRTERKEPVEQIAENANCSSPVDASGLVAELKNPWQNNPYQTDREAIPDWCHALLLKAADALASRGATIAELTKDRDYYAERYANGCGQLIVRDAEITRLQEADEAWRQSYNKLVAEIAALIARQQSLGVDPGTFLTVQKEGER